MLFILCVCVCVYRVGGGVEKRRRSGREVGISSHGATKRLPTCLLDQFRYTNWCCKRVTLEIG